MIVEVLHQATGIAFGCVGFCAGRAESVMNDHSGNKTEEQTLDQSLQAGAKRPKAASIPVKRTNIDEIARYVVEGLNRRKPEVQDHQSDS